MIDGVLARESLPRLSSSAFTEAFAGVGATYAKQMEQVFASAARASGPLSGLSAASEQLGASLRAQEQAMSLAVSGLASTLAGQQASVVRAVDFSAVGRALIDQMAQAVASMELVDVAGISTVLRDQLSQCSRFTQTIHVAGIGAALSAHIKLSENTLPRAFPTMTDFDAPSTFSGVLKGAAPKQVAVRVPDSIRDFDEHLAPGSPPQLSPQAVLDRYRLSLWIVGVAMLLTVAAYVGLAVLGLLDPALKGNLAYWEGEINYLSGPLAIEVALMLQLLKRNQ